MSEHDQIQRFLFEQTDIRGEIVSLEKSYQQALAAHDYPEPIRQLLGELISAAILLSTTLKFAGVMTLQAKSSGPIRLLMVDCNEKHEFRALARWEGDIRQMDLRSLLPAGHLVITIDPEQGKRYQGIVPLNGDTLGECFSSYFVQSEQLPTQMWLFADHEHATGLLLQALPASQETDPQQRELKWEHITTLAKTVKPEELLTLDPLVVLHRLFHEETVRVFPAEPVAFHCNCSREKTSVALHSIGREEAESVLEEQGELVLHCQFCNHAYHYNAIDIAQLFDDNENTSSSTSLH
ncbi:Hsp33 family molecular chaperone HslO [Zooshikella harenae]|uniref:33 kDa chaperonin n=1 Tax=Zooshikella harenae TaxID=2827238 RepID=A0ABS5ZCW4_9GAMM|nr:Hsp33 family molecular chaperone HslO [Zooshikella harenae]MBU2711889.1 Hsp33 family molecular chaperone HslO [Zooshikella harenae]